MLIGDRVRIKGWREESLGESPVYEVMGRSDLTDLTTIWLSLAFHEEYEGYNRDVLVERGGEGSSVWFVAMADERSSFPEGEIELEKVTW